MNRDKWNTNKAQPTSLAILAIFCGAEKFELGFDYSIEFAAFHPNSQQIQFISFLPSSYLKPLLPSKCVCFYANWFDFFFCVCEQYLEIFPLFPISHMNYNVYEAVKTAAKPDKDDKPCSEFGECILEWMYNEEEPRDRMKFNSF